MIFFLVISLFVVAWFTFNATRFSLRSRQLMAVTALMFLCYSAEPMLESMFRSETSILINQLNGRGCQYQGFQKIRNPKS